MSKINQTTNIPPEIKEIESNSNRIDTVNTIIRLNPSSKFELKARTGTLECYDIVSKKDIKIKFSSKSEIFKLLSGYTIIKDQFKKSRLIAIKIDSKGNASVLIDNELRTIEKKYKKLLCNWTVVHKNSLGI